jgi:type IV pilus assembly protein PilE
MGMKEGATVLRWSITMMERRQRGLTLLELMMVVAVIGILAAVAYPSYVDSMNKARRSDAFAALNSIQLKQGKWRANNVAYSSSITAIGAANLSPDGHYTLSIPSASTGAFTATATITGDQANDTDCKFITINQDGALSAKDSGNNNAPECIKR